MTNDLENRMRPILAAYVESPSDKNLIAALTEMYRLGQEHERARDAERRSDPHFCPICEGVHCYGWDRYGECDHTGQPTE